MKNCSPISRVTRSWPRLGARVGAAAALVLLLSACAQTTQIEPRYLAPKLAPDTARRTTDINRLLIAARTPDATYRSNWEAACGRVFSKTGMNVSLSYKALPDWNDLHIEELSDWALAHRVDAILMVDITTLLLAPPQPPSGISNDTFGISQNGPNEDDIGKPDWSFFIGRKEKRKAQPPRLHSSEAQLLSPSGKMLWDGLMTTHEANDLAAIASSQCEAIKQRLTKIKILPR